MIPASEFFHKKYEERYKNTKPGQIYPTIPTSEFIADAIEFTKLHVRAALEAASKVELDKWSEGDSYYSQVDKEGILNCYPEENIK